MKTINISLLVSALILNSAYATTTFTGGVSGTDTDFNDAANWNATLPDADAAADGADRDAVIPLGKTAITTASYGTGAPERHYNLDILGALTIDDTHTVSLGDGSGWNTGTDLTVDGGLLNIDGTILVYGGGAHAFVTNGGIVNLNSGGDLEVRKDFNLTNGTLNIASDAASTASDIDHLNVGSGSTIHFDIATTDLTTMILQQDLDISAGGAILDLAITGATAGDTYTLFTAAGGGGIDGTFATFNYSVNDSLVATLDYGVPGELTVDITAVPEPSSAALLGLGGLALLLRRRK